jgi:hypothetical protein
MVELIKIRVTGGIYMDVQLFALLNIDKEVFIVQFNNLPIFGQPSWPEILLMEDLDITVYCCRYLCLKFLFFFANF